MSEAHRAIGGVLAGAALCLSSAAASADDFDWHKPADRVVLNSALHKMAGFCSTSFGFNPAPEQSPTAMDAKIEAHLLLEPSADYKLQEWAKLVSRWGELGKKANDDAFIERLSDAIIAAYKDPDSYTRAEALYVDHGMAPVTDAFEACREGTDDAFIAKNYWSGDGTIDRYRAMLKESFAESVATAK